MTGRSSGARRSDASPVPGAIRPPSNSTPVSAVGFQRALAFAEHAAFSWECRRSVARSSAVTFEVLARLDERVSRLVYKLSERPVLADRLLRHDHAAFRSGLAFVTAVVALRGGVFEVFEEQLTQLESDPTLLAPLASALSWLEYSDVRPHIEHLLGASSPALLRLGVVATVAQRVDPGVALARALDAKPPALRASALEAVGRLALRDFLPRLHAAFEDEDDTCRFWAAWSAVRLGEHEGIRVLGRFATEGGAFAIPACNIALRALDADQAVRTHARLLSVTGNERLALVAAGIIGDPALVSRLLDAMESPMLARRAGAAFCLMTGCDLRQNDLDAEGPPRETAAPDAVPQVVAGNEKAAAQLTREAGDSLDDESDDDLAWPDNARLRQWWDEHRSAYVRGVRYLSGLPIRPAQMAQVLRTGNQQQRAAASLELALLNPHAPWLDVTAPAHRQVGASGGYSPPW